MKTKKAGYGYNERLFSGGFRSKLHLARFRWLQSEIAKRKCRIDSVLELGCYDGKLIEFLPKKPRATPVSTRTGRAAWILPR